MEIRAVLDTNIYISALFWRGAPHEVLTRGLAGRYTIVTSPEIMGEVFQSLGAKFKFPLADARSFLEIIAAHADVIAPTTRLRVVGKDPADDKIIECAIAGNAIYVVTGDKVLLAIKRFRETNIITPAQFLLLISRE